MGYMFGVTGAYWEATHWHMDRICPTRDKALKAEKEHAKHFPKSWKLRVLTKRR